MTTSEWLTRQEAADLAGCPITAIDWHKRQGRIAHRPRVHGGLARRSVEEFATWWRERVTAGVDPTERSVRQPPEPEGWLSTRAAAEVVGKSPKEVGYLVSVGNLPGVKHAGRLWVRAEDVNAFVREENRWISQERAAVIIGVSSSTVKKYAAEGRIAQRQAATRVPSMELESVVEFAREHRARLEETKRKRLKREAQRSGPPSDGDVWFDSDTTARVLGLSAARVRQLSTAERLPWTLSGGRRWFRRDHVEQAAAARTARSRLSGRQCDGSRHGALRSLSSGTAGSTTDTPRFL